MSEIVFTGQNPYPDSFDKEKVKKILQDIFRDANIDLDDLNIIIVSDDYLQELHKKYLDDPRQTDVMAFNLSEKPDSLSGEIYISIDRAREQAEEYGCTELDEVYRYIFHGALHLCGFEDVNREDREKMKKSENFYLDFLKEYN